MPERRFEHVEEVRHAGLTPPDEATLHYLWQIVDEGVLGASRHVALGNELVLHLVGSGEDGVERARLAIDFIARTRGHDTPVIGNSLRRLVEGLDRIEPSERPDVLRQRSADWDKAAKARREALVEAAVGHLSDCARVLAFDYSSTVADILVELSMRRAPFCVVVPESRTITGGVRYLEAFLPRGISIVFVPDAAIEYALAECDAVLLGVETLRADGSFLNTIGSRMTARLACSMGIEVFGATDLLKLDMRSYGGHRPTPAIRSYDPLLKEGLTLAGIDDVDTSAPELEVVPPELTSAIFTEHGPVPPAAIWALGRESFGDDARGHAR